MVELKDDQSFRTNDTDQSILAGKNIVLDDDEEDDDKFKATRKEEEDQKMDKDPPGPDFSKSWMTTAIAAAEGLFKLIDWVIKTVLVTVFTLCFFVLTIHIILNFKTGALSSPKEDLQNFVVAEKQNNRQDLSSIEDLETESYETYSAAYCIEGSSLQRTRDALDAGLNSIPEAVRIDIVNKALQDGITGTNTWKNSQADLEKKYQAHSYMAYYSTTYDYDTRGMEMYKTCVLATGITFKVAETAAGFQETEEEYVVGMKLDCGFFTCSRIPKYGKRTLRTPVFKRKVLSLKQQKDLHTWMVQQAIESAGYLVGTGPALLDGSGDRLHLSSSAEERSAWSYSPLELAHET